MSYLTRTRTAILLGSFLISSLLLVQFPEIDLYISRMLFDPSLTEIEHWWGWALVRDSLAYSLAVSMISVLAVYVFNRVTKRSVCRVDGRKVLYLFLVLTLGAGLIVNAALKDNFGRARPRDIEEFGGSKLFTPAFVISQECDKNCSFSSGEGAGAFFFIAMALALSRKPAILVAAIGYGCLVSILRIAAGAHFFSDIVVSFFVMLILADALYFYMGLPIPERSDAATNPSVPPGKPATVFLR